MLILKINKDQKEKIHNAITGEESYIDDTIVLGDDPDDKNSCVLIIGGNTNKKETCIDLRN